MTDLGNDLSPNYLNRLLVDLDLLNIELAKISGVSVRTVYRWLRGTTPPPRSVIIMLELMKAKA